MMENKIEILDLLYQGLKFKDAVYTEKNNICVMNFLYNPEKKRLWFPHPTSAHQDVPLYLWE